MVVVAKKSIHAATGGAFRIMRHWVLFFEPTKKTFGLLDARFAPIEKILLAFDAHGFLSSGCLCEELSTVSATVGHRRTCAAPFLPVGRRCETSEREDGMSLGVLQEKGIRANDRSGVPSASLPMEPCATVMDAVLWHCVGKQLAHPSDCDYLLLLFTIT